MRFWLLCDGLCLECWRIIYFFASSRFLVLRRLFLSSFSLHRSSRPRSPFCADFFRGRRQLPQAGEVRRPRTGPCGVVEVVG